MSLAKLLVRTVFTLVLFVWCGWASFVVVTKFPATFPISVAKYMFLLAVVCLLAEVLKGWLGSFLKYREA